MAFIDIHTNNQSRELRNAATFVDNWAYVPGTSRTGDWKKPYAFTSLDDFNDTCGIGSPEGSITYEYVSGLLSSGIPVLFRRIACTGQDTASEKLGVTQAETIITHFDADTSADVQDLKIMERFGGTWGNDLSVSIRNTGTAYWMDIYYKYTLIERNKLIAATSTDTQLEISQKLINAFQTMQFARVVVEVLQTDPSKFSLQTITMQKLTGGTDFDESKVPAEIPKSYEFIKDKILYQPKFLTSGGYTDSDLSTSSVIATAMIKLTLERQDCRALPDLAIGTPAEEQQTAAATLGYQQLSDDQPIPSASMCAPWQYMEVGANAVWMPASYAYLTVMGSSLSKGGTAYTPKAGVANGQVLNIIRPEFDIGSDIAEQWQSDTTVNINPIMQLQGGRYVIAGNSTLLMPESTGGEENAFSESSADLAVIEMRRFVYNIASELQYQYNAAESFETFSIRASNYLEQRLTNGAVSKYDIYNISTDAEPRKLKIKLDVWVVPTIKKIEVFLNIAYGSVELNVGGGN